MATPKGIPKHLSDKLNEKQKLFCRYYLKESNFNGTNAYLQAGYKKGGAKSGASRLLALPHVQEYLAYLVKQQEDEDLATIREVTQFLTDVMRGDKKDTIITAHGLKEARTQVKDMLKAAELLGKRMGMFTDYIHVTDERSKVDSLIDQIEQLKESRE